MPEPKKVGRPSRKDELKKAIEEVGIDAEMVDPFRILSALAIDSKIAPMTRITACVALIEHPRKPIEPAPSVASADSADQAIPDDDITRRALQILKTGSSR